MTAVDRILAERLVVLLRGVTEPDSLVAGLVEAGVVVVEFTMETPGAEDAIARVRARNDVTVLAGTVRTRDEVERAVAAGAEACASPGYVPEVVERTLELGIPAIPGAFTPSEIEAAHRAGATMVKLFPATVLGPEYLRDIRAPLGDIAFVATGGIDADNAPAFLEAGARAVAVGSAITKAPDPASAARDLVAAVRRPS